jgi:hypothetical protein
MTVEPQGGGHPLAGLASLRRLMRPPSARERCDLCSADLGEEHDHLVELAGRRLACACEPCAILFSNRAAAKYRRVPRRVELLNDFKLTDVGWAALQLPIELAFFLHGTAAGGVVALYPSPGGLIESAVAPDAWEVLAEDNPVLRDFEPDVEALLVNRVRGARECYRVGVDHCYKLVGLLRQHWSGFSGGEAVWEEITRFFAGLKERSHHA